MNPTTQNTQSNDQRLAAFEAIVEHGYANNQGVRLHYAACGAGPLVVLMHGFPDHWLGWWQVMDRLRSTHRVVAMDLRGYNLSDKPSGIEAYAVARLLEDVQAVIRHQGADQATLVGHDWGGFIAWHAAMQTPELVDRLAVLNMPHPWAIARELADSPRQRKASEYVRLFRQPQAHLVFPPERLGAWVSDPAYRARHDEAMAASSLDAMFNYYRANWPAEPYSARRDVPAKVEVPTLLIHGLDDPYALPEGLNDVWYWVDAELEIHTLPDVGHFVQHERGDRVSMLLQQWLARSPARLVQQAAVEVTVRDGP